MYVGIARLVLQIPGARTLKDRRQVVRSFRDRIKARLSVSAAEVGETDKLQLAVVGVSVVSNDSQICYEQLTRVRSIAEGLPEALLAEVRSDVLSFGVGGKEMELDFASDSTADPVGDLPWGPKKNSDGGS